MSNLLPREARRAVRTEYWMRVIAVWGILMAVILSVTALLLFPTYFLVSARLAAAETEMTHTALAGNVSSVDVKNKIIEANRYAAQLRSGEDRIKNADVLSELEKERLEGITLGGTQLIEIENGMSVTVSGVAATREVLSAFVTALKRNPYFADATVPVSDLARATNAPFSVTVTILKK